MITLISAEFSYCQIPNYEFHVTMKALVPSIYKCHKLEIV